MLPCLVHYGFVCGLCRGAFENARASRCCGAKVRALRLCVRCDGVCLFSLCPPTPPLLSLCVSVSVCLYVCIVPGPAPAPVPVPVPAPAPAPAPVPAPAPAPAPLPLPVSTSVSVSVSVTVTVTVTVSVRAYTPSGRECRRAVGWRRRARRTRRWPDAQGWPLAATACAPSRCR
eukprot:6205478-Pleurochrysis_carterae.AAC.1